MAALLGMLGGGGGGGLGAGAGAGGSAGPSSASGTVGNVSVNVASGGSGISGGQNPLTNIGQIMQLLNQGSNVTNNLNGTNMFGGTQWPYDNPGIGLAAAAVAPSPAPNYTNWILIGGGALVVLLVILKKR